MWEDRLGCLPSRELHGLRVHIASTPRARLLGLALLDELPSDAALLIPRCRSIHSFGMRFQLDVVFIDEGSKPVRLAENVPPRRLLSFRAARAVIEMPAGTGGRLVAALSQARPRGW
jgi:uncharacterized membrane protein (UPF0127 family)